MSSMVRVAGIILLASSALTASAPLDARDAESWDLARQQLIASEPDPTAQAIDRWQQLSAGGKFGFGDYAGFLLVNPGFPDEAKLRSLAEEKLLEEQVPADRQIAYFDRFAPVTNAARAQYAIALSAAGRPEALGIAREAWRHGEMSPTAEATLMTLHGTSFTQDDHDVRMDALLWENQSEAANRQLARTSQLKRSMFEARLIAVQGNDPRAMNSAVDMGAMTDPGYAFNLLQMLRRAGRVTDAVNLAATRPKFASLPLDHTALIDEMLTLAQRGNARAAQRIAASVDDAFAPDTDISALEYKLRDDYTSLMWLGGTEALWELNEPANAAPLFYRYGAAARTPQTRAKGFYWAGLAASKAGDTESATRYYAMAGEYPERFYGQLALGKLGQPMPDLSIEPQGEPGPELREAFLAKPLTKAVREVARDAPWSVGIKFYREIASQAESEQDFALINELAESIGRRDLAVILGEAAGAKGHRSFVEASFPTLVAPPATDWTMVHAISRQESQFAQNAISRVGARGLMQLMPGTAKEQAGKIGVQYLSASLIDSPEYNIRLGDGYFARMMSYYGGSYPLAVGAYNAGPGRINEWLKANGDPRKGELSWEEWIERIPRRFETRSYIQRVLENAVVYEAMHPDKAGPNGPRGIADFLANRPQS